jgi:methyltransferase (TIGR00027 family)
MKLPNLSYMMSVGELRYIQSYFEKPEYRNPDSEVGAFLTLSKRIRCMLRGTMLLSRSRADPFYYYVLARTRYYDQVFCDAVHDSLKTIVNVGCGSDTRAYRFARQLREEGVTVLECDQERAIRAKEQIARRKWSTDHVKYVCVDLNDNVWLDFIRSLGEHENQPILVIMEGVSPYVCDDSFRSFLRLLATSLRPGSAVAYDFKLRGMADAFGRSHEGQNLFRLPGNRQEIDDYHRELGFELRHMELSSELSRRVQPQLGTSFNEDCLVRLVTTGSVRP